MQNSRNKAEKARDYLGKRFGVAEEDLEGYALKERSGDVWLVSEQVEQMGDDLEVETYGVRAIRFMKIGLKPTTYLLQFLGDRIKKNVAELEKHELEKLLAREEMIPANLTEKGYVALKFKGRIIGCGFYKDGVVSSRVPKGRSRELLELLAP